MYRDTVILIATCTFQTLFDLIFIDLLSYADGEMSVSE